MNEKPKKEKTKRQEFDFYETPEWCVHRIIERLNLPSDNNLNWLECGAGGGAIIDAVNNWYTKTCPISGKKDYIYGDGYIEEILPNDRNWKAVEIQPELESKLIHKVGGNYYKEEGTELYGHNDNVIIKNYLDVSVKDLGVIPDIIFGNPPYKLAIEFIKKSFEFRPEFIVFLLRLNFLSSKERCEFFKNNMPDVYVLPDRPAFIGSSADMTEYCFMVWSRNKMNQASGLIEVLNSTPLSERKRNRKA